MMPDENGWHLAQAQLADYAGGRSTVAQAASVEMHVTACADCRSMLADVLPELPVERMWQHILAATDPAPSARSRGVGGRTRRSSWTAWFPASVSGPRRIGIAVLTFLLGFTLMAPLAFPRDRKESVGAVTSTAGSPQPAVEFPPLPETFLRSRGASHLPSATVPASQLRSGRLQVVHREPRDRIPWRSGRHPD